MKRKLLLIIFLELILLFVISIRSAFYRSYGDEAHVNIISKDQVISTSSSTLKHFYEPKPNTIDELDLSWMGNAYRYKVHYHINREGFNQLKNYGVEKKSEDFRVLTIGDSFTFGVNVNTKDNYPSQLQDILNKECKSKKTFQVLNMGVYGYDFQYTVERFRVKGIKYLPDLIVWHIIGDDFERVNESLIPLVEKYKKELKTKDADKIILKENDPNPAWTKAKKESVRSFGVENNLLKKQHENIELIFRYFKGKLVFTISPNYAEKYRNLLMAISKAHKNTYVFSDMRNVYAENAYLPDFHPSNKGSRMIAEDTFAYLNIKKLIPCIQ